MLLYNIYILFISFSTHLGLAAVVAVRFLFLTLAGISPTIAIWLLVSAVVLVLQLPYLGSIAVLPYIVLSALGIVKKEVTWCVVYDSKTKLPIDPAYVIVRNMQGREISTIITDLNGRFSLILPQGLYVLEANKTNYAFPSREVYGEEKDGKYDNLYFGSVIEIKDDERSVAISIPMDPVSQDWNQNEKKRKKLFYRFDDHKTYVHAAKTYGWIALLLTALHCARYQSVDSLNQALIAVAAIIFISLYSLRGRQYSHSFVVDRHTHQALAFARVTIFSAKTKNQVSQKTTSFEGQFVCLLSKGTYYVTIERRDEKGAYSLAYTSDPFSVNDGYIGKRFAV